MFFQDILHDWIRSSKWFNLMNSSLCELTVHRHLWVLLLFCAINEILRVDKIKRSLVWVLRVDLTAELLVLVSLLRKFIKWLKHILVFKLIILKFVLVFSKSVVSSCLRHHYFLQRYLRLTFDNAHAFISMSESTLFWRIDIVVYLTRLIYILWYWLL